MSKMRALCAFLSVLLLSCTSKVAPPSDHVIFNQHLQDSYHRKYASFSEERSPLSFSEDNSASDCKSYLEMSARFTLEETVQNQLVKAEYLVCDALKILSDALPAKADGLSLSNRAEQILSKLDLRSFPSSLRQKTSDVAYTLSSLYPVQASASANAAQVEDDDWTFSLEIAAAARVNENDEHDLIVWLIDESRLGNYRGYQTLVIYDPESNASLKGVPYP